MPTHNKKPDSRQLGLPFSTPDPLRVSLASIDARVAGVRSESRMRQIREVVMAVWLCGRRDGCRARAQALMAVANQGASPPLFRSESTFRRALAAATKLGLVSSERTWTEVGQGPSERTVHHTRIAELVELSRDATRSLRATRSDSHLTGTCQSPERHRPYRNKTSESAEALQAPETSSTAIAEKTAITEEAEEVLISNPEIPEPSNDDDVERFVAALRSSLDVKRAREAVAMALGRGCTLGQLRERARWFFDRRLSWAVEHRGGAAYCGIAEATPELPVHHGWPHVRAQR